MVPDANPEDTTLYAYGTAHEEGEGNEARGDAHIKIAVGWESVPAGGRMIVQADETHSGDSGTNSTNRRIYYWSDLLVNSIGASGYTVRYTQTNITKSSSEGTFPAGSENTLPSGATGTTVPAFGSALKIYFNVYALSEGEGGDETEEGQFDINLIFEHATLPTMTFTHNWHAEANATSDAEGGS